MENVSQYLQGLKLCLKTRAYHVPTVLWATEHKNTKIIT